VSVVVITRDRPRLLADALASVARQTPAPLEVRLADDGDTPAFDAIPMPALLEVTVLRVAVRQGAAARNAAARGARGELLAFLDDDDRWRPGHLAPLAAAFADAEVALAFRDSVVVREQVDEHGTREDLERRTIARDWDGALMRTDDFVPPSAWMVRRELFEHLGGFDESFRYSEDWDFLLRASALTRPRRVPGVTVEVRMRESGHASQTTDPERLACLARLAARHGLPPLVPKTFWDVAEIAGAPRT
jgi:glycosyltransferase involved in cell wall biosynthesis